MTPQKKVPAKKRYTLQDLDYYSRSKREFNDYGYEYYEHKLSGVKFSGANINLATRHKLINCTFNDCTLILSHVDNWLTPVTFSYCTFKNCVIRYKKGYKTKVSLFNCVLKDTEIRSRITSNFSKGDFTAKTDFINCVIKGGYDVVDFMGVNLEGTKGFKYKDTSSVEHKGVTVEEKAMMGKAVQRLVRSLDKVKSLNTLLKKVVALEEQPAYKKHFGSELRSLRSKIRSEVKERAKLKAEAERLVMLEKQAGLFTNPVKQGLVSLTKAIAKDLLRYRVISKKGNVQVDQEDTSHFTLEMPVIGLRGKPLRLKVVYRNTTIHVALYDPNNYGYDKTLLFMGGFTPEDSNKKNLLQDRLRDVLTDRKIGILLKDLR